MSYRLLPVSSGRPALGRSAFQAAVESRNSPQASSAAPALPCPQRCSRRALRSFNRGPAPLPPGRGPGAVRAAGMAGAAARGPLLLLLLLLPPAASTQPELRFRPPAEAPVRLFTEPELARYDGQQVGPGRARTAPALRSRRGARVCAALLPRRPAILPRCCSGHLLLLGQRFVRGLPATVCSSLSPQCRGCHTPLNNWVPCAHSAHSLLGRVLPTENFRLPQVGAKVNFLSVIH